MYNIVIRFVGKFRKNNINYKLQNCTNGIINKN